MRLSIYEPSPLNKEAVIYLNGEIIKDVIMADEELGFVKHYVRGEDGNLMKNAAGDAALSVKKHGKVKIMFPGDSFVVGTGKKV